jgi:Fe-S-cluster containining protein
MKELPAHWKDGIRFQCQGTGRCCVSRGTYGYVYLDIHDRRRLAKAVGVSTTVFTKKYCLKHDGYYYLGESEKQCRFLEGKRCGVYEARPNQCRTWPFWPEHLQSKSWNEALAFCKGIGKGPVYSEDHIRAMLALNSD